MKPILPSIIRKKMDFIFLFLTTTGLGYFLIKQFILNKPNNEMLLIMLAFFVASIAAWQRKKYSN